jgi:hypothetical protein
MASSPITSTHKEYGASLLKWGRLRDAMAGRDAIMAHDAAEALKPAASRNSYLPPLSEQEQAEYAAMQVRASWFGATDRTVNALAGLIFAKDPEVKVHGTINALLRNIDLRGTNLRDFAQKVVVEELTTSRVGLMVEFPDTDTSAMTQAQAELANARPYITAWAAEQIQDWRVGNVPGQGSRLTLVKLRESVATFEDDLSPAVYVTQYRILDLFEGYYRQRVYRETDSKEWALAVEIFPTSQNERLRYIPFTIVGGTEVRKPLLLDLADVNFAHYRTDADYSNGLHRSAVPQIWIAGAQLEAGQKLQIGSSEAWVFPDPAAKAGYLEFSGQGLDPHRNRLSDLEKQMAILGARSLGGEKASNETATGAELRSAGERGTLAGVAADVSDAIRQCLDWMAARFGESAGAEFSLNRDYGLHRMDPQMLAQLVAAYQSGAMPVSVLFSNLKRGDIVPADMDEQTYMAGLDEATPTIAKGQE